MRVVQVPLEVGRVAGHRVLLVLVLLLKVFVVELRAHVFLVVHPPLRLVRVLLVEVSAGRSSVDKNVFAVVPNPISHESLVSPSYHLSPQVGVHPALVHGGVGLECMLNV